MRCWKPCCSMLHVMPGEPLYPMSAHLPLLRRFVNANKQCARSEALLRYNLYIDSMPINDLPALNSDQVSSGSGCRRSCCRPSSRAAHSNSRHPSQS